MAKRQGYQLLWVRLTVTLILLLLIVFFVGLIVFGSNSSNNDIALGIFAALSLCVAVGQWFFPISNRRDLLHLPYARELVRESASFRMGDTDAANFDYIIEPIQEAYDTARRTLKDASIEASPKQGILILGVANTGKTRLAFESLTQTLPDWKVFLWSPTYDAPEKVPQFTISRGRGLVVFIDDLQMYVPPEGPNTDLAGVTSDNRIATLQAFLNKLQTMGHWVVVVTCRFEDETRVGARLRWLFDQLQEIRLRSFWVETSDPISARIIDLFQQHGITEEEVKDWDGTLGSLVLGLSKKRGQYEELVLRQSPSVTVLHAMKLLTLTLINAHTQSRVQEVCKNVFGVATLQEDLKVWQDSVSQLARLEFVAEVKDRASGSFVLVIRKDAYFEEVITDYPMPNLPFQLDQHFEQLQKVLVGLNDAPALINLANAYSNRRRYEEALAACSQAIRLDPTYARAYNGMGNILNGFKRYEAALTAYEEATRLDPTDVRAYNGKGNALYGLKRYEAALVAYEQAIRLDPTFSFAYNGKGNVLYGLKRYEAALVAYEQATRFDPNYTSPHGNMGNALNELKRYEKALVAYEQATRLDPTDVRAYNGKGNALHGLKRYEAALTAYEQATRLDPNYARAYNGKGNALYGLKRYEAALVAYEQAIRLDPSYASPHGNKSNALYVLKRYEEALAACERAVQLEPTYARAYNGKGNILNGLKRYEAALAAYEQAAKLAPTFSFAYNGKGNALYGLKRYEEALVAYEQAIRLDPTFSFAYNGKANVLYGLKRYEEALAAYEQATRLDPTDTRAKIGKRKYYEG